MGNIVNRLTEELTEKDLESIYEMFNGVGAGAHKYVITGVVKKGLKGLNGKVNYAFAFRLQDPTLPKQSDCKTLLWLGQCEGHHTKSPVCKASDNTTILSRTQGNYGSFVTMFAEKANGMKLSELRDAFTGKEISILAMDIFVVPRKVENNLGQASLLYQISLGDFEEVPANVLSLVATSQEATVEALTEVIKSSIADFKKNGTK